LKARHITIFLQEGDSIMDLDAKIPSKGIIETLSVRPGSSRSKVRARVEHVFGDLKNSMGAEIVRTIGIVRARCKIGMTNLAYNMRRFVCLERMATATG
jgi:Transposase DDE domain